MPSYPVAAGHTMLVLIHTIPASSRAGEDGDNIQPKLQMLHSNGIGGILDYAAEDDVGAEDGPASRSQPHDSVIARYASHMKPVLDCNQAACSCQSP